MELVNTANFIVQTISLKNKLLETQYLALPEEATLKNLYLVRAVNYNIRKEDRVDNYKLLDSLNKKNIPRYELIDAYYGMLFASIGNKNRPFNLSRTDFK